MTHPDSNNHDMGAELAATLREILAELAHLPPGAVGAPGDVDRWRSTLMRYESVWHNGTRINQHITEGIR